jgi:hypothetical protein
MSYEDLENRIECLEQTQNHIIDAQNHIIDAQNHIIDAQNYTNNCLNTLTAATKNRTSNIFELIIAAGYIGAIVYGCSMFSKIVTAITTN